MHAFDITPLFKTSIGFDRLMEAVDTALRTDGTASYPPYNIVRAKNDPNRYFISIAIAGFCENDLDVTVREHILVVSGKTRQDPEDIEYLYRGIAGRAFKKEFVMDDYIRVGQARIHDGLLTIELIREVPETMKPRKVKIESGSEKNRLIEQAKED